MATTERHVLRETQAKWVCSCGKKLAKRSAMGRVRARRLLGEHRTQLRIEWQARYDVDPTGGFG